VEELEGVIWKEFHCSCRLVEILRDIDFAYHEGRDQYYSTAILKELDKRAPEDLLKVLAITGGDLFIPILTYVFGEAQLGGRCALLSSHRLKPPDRSPASLMLYKRRMIKEALHELGHTFNLKHCREETCIMHYCRSIRNVDSKDESFCRYCMTFLRDEFKRLGLDPSSLKELTK